MIRKTFLLLGFMILSSSLSCHDYEQPITEQDQQEIQTDMNLWVCGPIPQLCYQFYRDDFKNKLFSFQDNMDQETFNNFIEPFITELEEKSPVLQHIRSQAAAQPNYYPYCDSYFYTLYNYATDICLRKKHIDDNGYEIDIDWYSKPPRGNGAHLMNVIELIKKEGKLEALDVEEEFDAITAWIIKAYNCYRSQTNTSKIFDESLDTDTAQRLLEKMKNQGLSWMQDKNDPDREIMLRILVARSAWQNNQNPQNDN